MGYDQERDKLIKLFEMKQDKSSVLFSIFCYDKGKPKLGITRSFEKKDGTVGYSNSGRLDVNELKFLRENLDKIIEIMENEKM